MAKKIKNQDKKPVEARYYDLNTDAIERLLNAKNAPAVSDEEIEKYTSKHKRRFPSWLKVVLIKVWFSGAVCYFVMWGLGLMISGLDLIAALAIVLGLVNDLMVNNVLRHFEPFSGAYNKWMMFPFKKFWTIFLNVIYSAFILFFVVQSYTLINTLLVGDAETAETVAVGVEPILFGLLFTGFDILFVTIKNALMKAFKAADTTNAGKSK